MKTTQSTGRSGENITVNYLQKNGYTILERNWRYLKSEVDIIASNKEWVVFVEVKTRSSDQFGNPEDFVTDKQQKMIINAAQEYIERNDIDLEARFDIVAIVEKGGKHSIEHFEEAFYPTLY